MGTKHISSIDDVLVAANAPYGYALLQDCCCRCSSCDASLYDQYDVTLSGLGGDFDAAGLNGTFRLSWVGEVANPPWDSYCEWKRYPAQGLTYAGQVTLRAHFGTGSYVTRIYVYEDSGCWGSFDANADCVPDGPWGSWNCSCSGVWDSDGATCSKSTGAAVSASPVTAV